MNAYLVALIALVAAYAVGYIIYGQLFKGPLGTAGEKMDPMHLTQATVLLYATALTFTYLFDHITLGDMTGVSKGVAFGLFTGLALFAFPLYVDSGFLKAKKEATNAILLNWMLSFVVMGLVVGWLR